MSISEGVVVAPRSPLEDLYHAITDETRLYWAIFDRDMTEKEFKSNLHELLWNKFMNVSPLDADDPIPVFGEQPLTHEQEKVARVAYNIALDEWLGRRRTKWLDWKAAHPEVLGADPVAMVPMVVPIKWVD
jgi:hypothetical protein